MKVGIYSRVSTSDKGQDPELQLRDLRKFCEARGFEIYKEYVDQGVSGSKENRPALDKLMDDCRKRRIDGIGVWRLDRLSRNLKHLISTLDELGYLGVSFFSYNENIDTSSIQGRLMFQLLGAFAEFSRNLTVENVKAGMAKARSLGKRIGKPPKVIDMDKLRELKLKNLSIRQIAREMSLSKGLVESRLKVIIKGI